jgi:hypothetical protein
MPGRVKVTSAANNAERAVVQTKYYAPTNLCGSRRYFLQCFHNKYKFFYHKNALAVLNEKNIFGGN